MINKKVTVLISFIAILCLPFSNAIADKIVIAGDIWCPFNCENDSAKPGYMVEIAQKVFTGAGHSVEYTVLPWERAVQECRDGKLSGIIGAYVADAPDFIYPKNELGRNSDSIFVLKEKNWIYRDMSSLSGITIGVIKGYAYASEELNNYIKKNSSNQKIIQLSYGDSALEMSIKKMAGGRLDAIVESPAVFWYMANKMGMKNRLKLAGNLSSPKKVYIAFSPAEPKSKEYARILSDGIDELRKSGELKKILNRYGLDDWK